MQYWFNCSLGFHRVFFTNLTAQALLAGALRRSDLRVRSRSGRRYGECRFAQRDVSRRRCGWRSIAGLARRVALPEFLLAVHGVPFEQIDPVFGQRHRLLRLLAADHSTDAQRTALDIRAHHRFDDRRALRPHAPESACSRAGCRLVRAHAALFIPPWMRRLWDAEGMVVAGLLFLALFAPVRRQRGGGRAHRRAVRRCVGLLFNAELHPRQHRRRTLPVLSPQPMDEAGGRSARLDAEPVGGATAAPRGHHWRMALLAQAAAAFLALDFLFFAAVVVRDHVFVKPNEPWIQVPFIERHMRRRSPVIALNRSRR